MRWAVIGAQPPPSRWAALFADLEAQGAALDDAELAAEVAERTRGEVGTLGVVDRARAALGAELRLHLCGGLSLFGRLAQVGPDWLLLHEVDGCEALVALAQLISVRGLTRYSAVPGSVGVVESRMGIRQVLRALARDRARVRLHLTDGSVREVRIDRVGADFVELAYVPAVGRRRGDAQGGELVPVTAIAAVRRSV